MGNIKLAPTHTRNLVKEVIKEIAQSPPLDTLNKPPFKGSVSCVTARDARRSLTFRHDTVVILNEVERLSKEAQHALRRTMEKYMSVCRLVLCCNSTSKVPICLDVHLLSSWPNTEDQTEFVNNPLI